MTEAAFYSVANERYFLGAVALLNSLRLHGHAEPLFICDCGLTTDQRDLLAEHATLVPGESGVAPWLQKTLAPLRHPAAVTVLVDADMIATRPLTELIEAAAPGNVVAFRNDIEVFFAEWGELLDLGTAELRPYVSSGLVALAGEVGGEVLRLWDDRQGRVDFEPSYFGRNVPGYPFPYLDQDVLNAILCTRVDPERIVALEHRLSALPPFDGLRVRDERAVRCAYRDGVEPYVLHHFDRKPWLARLRSNVYSRLLTRLLLAPDVALRLEESVLPLRLRTGLAARAGRLGTDLLMAFPGALRRLRDRHDRTAAAASSSPEP